MMNYHKSQLSTNYSQIYKQEEIINPIIQAEYLSRWLYHSYNYKQKSCRQMSTDFV